MLVCSILLIILLLYIVVVSSVLNYKDMKMQYMANFFKKCMS